MEVFDRELKSGKLELSEHVDSKWLSLNNLNTIKWVEADKPIVGVIKKMIRQRFKICMVNFDGTEALIWGDDCSNVTMERK